MALAFTWKECLTLLADLSAFHGFTPFTEVETFLPHQIGRWHSY